MQGTVAVIAARGRLPGLHESIAAELGGRVGPGSEGLAADITVLSAQEVNGLEFDSVVIVGPAGIVEESERGSVFMFSGGGFGHGRARLLRRGSRVALVLGVVGVLLSGCGLLSPDTSAPGFYEKVDAVVAELGLGSTGEVAYENHSGTGGFSAGARTAQLIIEGTGTHEVIRQRLEDAGFTSLNDDHWERGTGESTITVYLTAFDAGQTVITQDETETRVGHKAVLVSVLNA